MWIAHLLSCDMARKLRIEYDGALYHVINRGNYRRDVFETAGAAHAFVQALGEAAEKHQWKIHAYVVMRNHFHAAIETPRANLSAGMHWLQTTFASRFNRLRSEHGHLFQGRYQALLIEDSSALLRVANYIHLNPVRAGIVLPEQVALFRWSSLPALAKPPRPEWLVTKALLDQLQLADSSKDWATYIKYLAVLALDPADQERQGFNELSRGWVIGTNDWRTVIAKSHRHLAATRDIAQAELTEIKRSQWEAVLAEAMKTAGKTKADVAVDPKGAKWKIAAAQRLRSEASAPFPWIAEQLGMGSPSSVRVYLSQVKN